MRKFPRTHARGATLNETCRRRQVSNLQHVIDHNIAHRQLTVGQKAMISLAYRADVGADAKERQSKAGGDKSKALPATLPEALGDTREILAKRFGIGMKAVDKATVIKDYAPELAKEVAAVAGSVRRR